MLLTETKRRRTIEISTDLACDPQVYRAIQLNATEQNRGGMILILKSALRVETVELIRILEGDEFIQGIVIEERESNSMIGGYSAPTVTAERFGLSSTSCSQSTTSGSCWVTSTQGTQHGAQDTTLTERVTS